MNMQHAETLGWFGLTWQEKVAASMYRILGDSYKKTMKDFFQPGGYNIRLVDSLHSFYVLHGEKKLSKHQLSELSGHDVKVSEAFLLALQDEAVKGRIDYRLYDSSTVSEYKATKQEIFSPLIIKSLDKYIKYGAVIISGIVLLKLTSYIPKRSY